MPGSVSAGMPEKKASNAASPPADAPMPTTGHPGASCPDGGSTAFGSRFSSESFALQLVGGMTPCFLFSHYRSFCWAPSSPSPLRPRSKWQTRAQREILKLILKHVLRNRKLAAEMLGISLRTLLNPVAVVREAAEASTPEL